MTSSIGKRYTCLDCQVQLICTVGGEGTLCCCEQAMSLDEVKPLPSAD